jgi:pescadillo
MLTFLELYQTLLGFVFFKLYTDEGWVYPPPLDTNKDESGAGIGALNVIERTASKSGQVTESSSIKGISNKDVRQAIKEISNTSTDPSQPSSSTVPTSVPMEMEEDEDFVPQASKSDPNATNSSALPTFKVISATSSTNPSSRLFEGLNFWLSRETPRGLLEFVIRAFSGRVGWDASVGAGSMFDESSEAITHVVIDRPAVSGLSSTVDGTPTTNAEDRRRKYIQPQWVVDCVNAGRILSEEKYERGKVLPPHLSPFGEDKKVRLVFAISSVYAVVCADDFRFIIGSDVGAEEKGDTKGTEKGGQKAKEARA